MSVRDLSRRFISMDRNVADFDTETERGSVKSAQLDATSGDTLDFVYDAAPDSGLEGFGRRIPGESCDGDNENAEKYEDVTPELAPRQVFRFSGHWDRFSDMPAAPSI